MSCISNESPTGNTKIVWVLVIVCAGFFGALVYLLFRRPQRIREFGQQRAAVQACANEAISLACDRARAG